MHVITIILIIITRVKFRVAKVVIIELDFRIIDIKVKDKVIGGR